MEIAWYAWVWIVVGVVGYLTYLGHLFNRWWNWDRDGFLTEGAWHPTCVERYLGPFVVAATWPICLVMAAIVVGCDWACKKINGYRLKRLVRLGRKENDV